MASSEAIQDLDRSALRQSFTGRGFPPLFSGSEGSTHKSSGARTQ
uniref:Uncharacterized protein n=1 Tax=Zea mays TaxID=4577 RepID=C4J2Z9_MAIZE|nr:unknown [Zea mays]